MASETLSRLVTYDDYRHLPDDGKQYQIIGGELHMTPAPTTVHQRILFKLAQIIAAYVKENNSGEVLVAPVDVILSMTDVVQPDIIFISRERMNIITKKNIVEAPDLVVEIISEHTETIDRKKKKELYEHHGVKEYWIVDPESKTIEQYIPEGQKFVLKATAGPDETLTSPLLNEHIVAAADVFFN